jgi:hypothetical protein
MRHKARILHKGQHVVTVDNDPDDIRWAIEAEVRRSFKPGETRRYAWDYTVETFEEETS